MNFFPFEKLRKHLLFYSLLLTERRVYDSEAVNLSENSTSTMCRFSGGCYKKEDNILGMLKISLFEGRFDGNIGRKKA